MSHEEAVGRAVLALQDARERKQAAEEHLFEEPTDAIVAALKAASADIDTARGEMRRLGVKISLLH